MKWALLVEIVGGGGADENANAEETVPEPQDAAAGAAEKTVSEAPDTPDAGQDEAVRKTVPQAENTGHDAAEKTVSEAPDTPNAGQDEAVKKTVPQAENSGLRRRRLNRMVIA